MTKREKIITYGVLLVVSLEVLRHFTWREKATPGPVSKPFVPIGMDFRATVDRRA